MEKYTVVNLAQFVTSNRRVPVRMIPLSVRRGARGEAPVVFLLGRSTMQCLNTYTVCRCKVPLLESPLVG